MNKYYPEIIFRAACIWRLFRKYRDKSFFGITLFRKNPFYHKANCIDIVEPFRNKNLKRIGNGIVVSLL